MSLSDITSVLPQTCQVNIPSLDAKVHDTTPRWSDAGVSLPYAVVTPSITNDIIRTITYAASQNLKVIPVSGGHGSFVPITDRTIYLPMHKFNTISLDEEASEVTLGGGCTTGAVLKALAEKGWYTTLPNSNAVGVVGALLGGLNHGMVGLHGLGIDAIRSITLVPFSSPKNSQIQEVVLTPDTLGEEKALFNALRGAGHGLGIVTSVTLQAHRVSALNLTDRKVWTRRLVFPPQALPTAIKTYTTLLPSIPPQLSAVMVFVRAPPTMPVRGAPTVMLALSYFGSKEAAERVCAATFEEDLVEKAIVAKTFMTEFGALNDGFEALNRHGGFKEYHGAFFSQVNEAGITQAFETWAAFSGKDLKGRGGSYLVIGALNPAVSSDYAGNGDFFSARERGFYVQASPWYSEAREKIDADTFGRNAVEALGMADREAGVRELKFANNFRIGQDVGEVYEDKQIYEIKRVKGVWDASGIGWSPVADGW